jgi:putative NADPH-quinone reductase
MVTRSHTLPTEATRKALTPILVLAAHPHLEHSRVAVQMMRNAAASPLADHVQVRDLYALYPDYLIDVAAEQQALAAAQLVVWLQPLHWYGMTPLLKLWVDEVFAFGWAYGPGGTALAGKDLWLVASTGGAEDSYRLSAAVRADRGLGRHALLAAAAAARRAPRRRGRAGGACAGVQRAAAELSGVAGDG